MPSHFQWSPQVWTSVWLSKSHWNISDYTHTVMTDTSFSISAIAKMITVLQNIAGYNNASPTCIKHVDFLANKLVVCTAESATIMSRTTIWQYEGETSRAASKASWLVCDRWTHSDPTAWNRPKLIYPIGLKSIMGVGERNYLVKAWRTSLNAVQLC